MMGCGPGEGTQSLTVGALKLDLWDLCSCLLEIAVMSDAFMVVSR